MLHHSLSVVIPRSESWPSKRAINVWRALGNVWAKVLSPIARVQLLTRDRLVCNLDITDCFLFRAHFDQEG